MFAHQYTICFCHEESVEKRRLANSLCRFCRTAESVDHHRSLKSSHFLVKAFPKYPGVSGPDPGSKGPFKVQMKVKSSIHFHHNQYHISGVDLIWRFGVKLKKVIKQVDPITQVRSPPMRDHRHRPENHTRVGGLCKDIHHTALLRARRYFHDTID